MSPNRPNRAVSRAAYLLHAVLVGGEAGSVYDWWGWNAGCLRLGLWIAEEAGDEGEGLASLGCREAEGLETVGISA